MLLGVTELSRATYCYVFTQYMGDLFSILKEWEEARLLSDLRLSILNPESLSDCMEFDRQIHSNYLTLFFQP